MRRVWHGRVTCPVDRRAVCVCLWAVCERVLCIQTPSVWWPDTVWESVCRRRIHTQHKGPIMSPHSEKEKGGGRGDNRGLSISEGGMMVSLPLTSPSSLLPAPPQTNMCQQELSMEEIPMEKNRPAVSAFYAVTHQMLEKRPLLS